MENKKAITIIKDELKHCQIHLEDKNKAPEYYQEMNELCEAYELAIKALENSSPVLMMQNMSNDEYKERALAIVDVYSDINRISQRDAEILRKAILFYSRGDKS